MVVSAPSWILQTGWARALQQSSTANKAAMVGCWPKTWCCVLIGRLLQISGSGLLELRFPADGRVAVNKRLMPW